MLVTQEQFDKLIIDNQKFAYSIVSKEFSKYPWNVRDDLNSAAIEGLVYAATKYDPKREDECKFISYAVHWIRYYVNEEIRKLYPVRFNQNFVSKRNKIMRCIADYKKTHNDEEPSIKYISGCVHMSQKVVNNVLNVNNGENFTFLSFSVPTDVKDSESEQLTESKIVKEYLDTAMDEGFVKSIEIKDLLEVLKKESPETEFNVFYDYYVNGESFSELAKKYNLKFPSSAAYLIKKCEKRGKELAES